MPSMPKLCPPKTDPIGNDNRSSRRDDLLELVYDELRGLANTFIRKEREGHTLQPTALVHEAYLRLLELKDIEWRSREHFVAMAATMMRRVLVNHAIGRKREKRGGGQLKLSLTEADQFSTGAGIDFIQLESALNRFGGLYQQECRIVELKFFGGLSAAEIAEILNISRSTVERDWKFARAWLMRELSN
jgi:RNA polymerase sigma-70 factor, ECF subfamily